MVWRTVNFGGPSGRGLKMVEYNIFNKKIGFLLLVVIILFAVFLGFIFGGPTSVVNWSVIHAVAFESDDWGLAGFVPEPGLWQDLDRSIINEGPAFPEIYWESTLEDSSMSAMALGSSQSSR